MPKPLRPAAAAIASILLAGGVFSVSNVYAQTAAAERPAPRGQSQTGAARTQANAGMDALATRNDLIEILQKHPPAVAQILKLDPSLMRSESYLNSYPALRDFLAEHPEIPQNAPFYLEQVHGFEGRWQPRSERMAMVESTLSGVAAFTALVIVLGTLVWLVRTVLDQRRWSRLSKIQAEVHSKLMDRFSNNDELLTYVQTPSGRRFLESGPSPLEEGPRTVGAPFSRILWSVQLGVVMLVAGLGLLYVSTRTFEEAREFFFICGCLSMALGAGFTVSSAASYALSRKLGLLDGPTTGHA